MTHEDRTGIGGEPRGGPSIDQRLPDATSIPEYDDVEESMAPPMRDAVPHWHQGDYVTSGDDEPMPDARGHFHDEEG